MAGSNATGSSGACAEASFEEGGGARYGVTVAGVGLLLPARVPVEYVEAAAVYPLPRMPRRLIGVMQLRGRPVPVLAADSGFEQRLPTLRRLGVVVIGDGPMSGALPVDAPPRVLADTESVHPPHRPAAPLGEELDGAVAERDGDGTCWWRFDPVRLFEALVRAE